MRSGFWQGTLAAAIALPALSTAAQAHSERACSNATLTGEYAFGATGYTPPTVIAGVKFFDGKGNLTQRDFRGDSLRTMGQTDFSTGETGTYNVNPDCTGSMEISIPAPGLSPGILSIVFAISNGGRHIHEVVSEFTPPGSPTAAPTQTSADDWKVGLDEDDSQ